METDEGRDLVCWGVSGITIIITDITIIIAIIATNIIIITMITMIIIIITILTPPSSSPSLSLSPSSSSLTLFDHLRARRNAKKPQCASASPFSFPPYSLLSFSSWNSSLLGITTCIYLFIGLLFPPSLSCPECKFHKGFYLYY